MAVTYTIKEVNVSTNGSRTSVATVGKEAAALTISGLTSAGVKEVNVGSDNTTAAQVSTLQTGARWQEVTVKVPSGTTTTTVYIQGYGVADDDGIIYVDIYEGENDTEVTLDIDFSQASGDNKGYTELNIELNIDTPTANFTLNSFDDKELEQVLTAHVLDYNGKYFIQTKRQQGQRNNYTGLENIDILRNKLITYSVNFHWHFPSWTYPKVSEHIESIAEEMDMAYSFRGRDFYPSVKAQIRTTHDWTEITRQEIHKGRFTALIQELLGWSSDIPSMRYAVYIEDNTLCVVQRGYEDGQTITIQDANIVGHPVVTKQRIFTEWTDTQTATAQEKSIQTDDNAEVNEPFSGTIEFAGNSLTYENGYLMREVARIGSSEDSVISTYTYTEIGGEGYKYLTEKVITDSASAIRTTINYTYDSTDNEVYLVKEIERKEEIEESSQGSPTYNEIERRETIYSPSNNGFCSKAVYDTTDGVRELISTSLSHGTTGSRASQYMVDRWNDSIRDDGSGSHRQAISVPLNGVAKARNTYPVRDRDSLEAIANGLDSMQGKTEETVEIEAVGLAHVIRFNDIINYGGARYYLESNRITQTPNTVRQALVLKRWY